MLTISTVNVIVLSICVSLAFSETWDRNPDIEAALEFYENDLPSPHVVDVELLRWKRKWCSTEDADLPTSAVQTLAAYTLFQNGPHFSILLFDYKWPCWPSSRLNILLNSTFESEAKRASLQWNKRILKWLPFWNKVYAIESSFLTSTPWSACCARCR